MHDLHTSTEIDNFATTLQKHEKQHDLPKYVGNAETIKAPYIYMDMGLSAYSRAINTPSVRSTWDLMSKQAYGTVVFDNHECSLTQYCKKKYMYCACQCDNVTIPSW